MKVKVFHRSEKLWEGSAAMGADVGVGRELIRCRRKGTRCCCVPGERSVAAPTPSLESMVGGGEHTRTFNYVRGYEDRGNW